MQMQVRHRRHRTTYPLLVPTTQLAASLPGLAAFDSFVEASPPPHSSSLLSPSASRVAPQVIEPTGLWVTDRAGILSDSEISSLSAVLATYASESSTQIVIVTIPSLDGRDISSYTFELGEHWEVGRRGIDNGVVILVSVGDRKVFIATGYGVEASVSDVVAGRIVRDIITPSFRQGRFHEGLRKAVDALIAATYGQFEATQAVAARNPNAMPRIIYFALLVVIVIVVIIVI
ncbi:MAG: TPM domain-containing protein, partial [Chloroflexi bacterium]|nr:TPM domain-containing protein [Chloroflexota bacterium]